MYNAWYTRALQEKEIKLPEPADIPRHVLKKADAADMDKFVYLEGEIARRSSRHS